MDPGHIHGRKKWGAILYPLSIILPPTLSHILLGHCLSHPTHHHEQLSIGLQVAKGATSAA